MSRKRQNLLPGTAHPVAIGISNPLATIHVVLPISGTPVSAKL
jgi:hypothetical protein